jgi:uncharacterized protein (DUF1501 family)
MKRRDFLRTAGAAGATVAALPGLVDGFSLRAMAADDSPMSQLLAASDRVLVLIQLQGGNDGLNTLIPFENPRYHQARPTIGIRKDQTLPLTSTLGWHPSMDGFRRTFDEGHLAIVQGVTYPNPDRSHFRGTDIWLTATDANVFGSTGWMGRYLQTMAPDFPNVLPGEPLAVQIGSASSLGFAGTQGPMALTIRDPEEFYRLVTTGQNEEVPSAAQGNTPVGREVAYMRTVAASADVYARVVKRAADSGTNAAQYPNTDLASRLKVVAKLISGGLGSRVFLVSWVNNNFDTHANQVVNGSPTTGTHANLLRELSDAVRAFMQDMQQQGHGKRVAGMTFSEFGRRVAENGSTGTDHGTAAPLFVFGEDVLGGTVHGADPDLVNVDNVGDMLMQYDYREVYAATLLQWFGESSSLASQVLYRDFSQNALPLFRSVSTSVLDQGSGPRCGFTAVTPNPASSVVRFNISVEPFASTALTLHNVAGKVVATADVDTWSGTAMLDVSALPQGTYVATLTSNRRTVHTLVSVQR